MYRVMIVEDDPMARQLLEIYVKNSTNYQLVQCIESAALAEIHCMSEHIDLILMDVCTAMNASGLDASEKIKKHFPYVKIIVITSQPECSFIQRAKDIGVDSFWYKSASAEEIVSVMDRTMAGESVYPDSPPTVELGDTVGENFSERELEVLRLVIEGETDQEIADHLHMAVRTVKSHISHMKDKTGFRNRTELAVRVRECGFVINDVKNQ